MARPESVALGGYFPTPEDLTPLIARQILIAGLPAKPVNPYSFNGNIPNVSIVDPCAGEAKALIDFTKALLGDKMAPRAVMGTADKNELYANVRLYANELEATRHLAAQSALQSLSSSHRGIRFELTEGDAFRLEYSNNKPNGYDGNTVLFLNPPYENGKLELQFLKRFTGLLAPGGILVYLIPFYALKESAQYLTKHFSNVAVRKFPEPHFSSFKQVVVYAKRRAVDLPVGTDYNVFAEYNELLVFNADSDAIPVLGYDNGPVIVGNARQSHGMNAWKIAAVDMQAVYELHQPWTHGRKGVPITDTGMNLSLDRLIGDPLEVAMPLRPAHVALVLSTGMLNGKVLKPEPNNVGLPAIIAKGVFIKDIKKQEEKTDKKGNVTAVVCVQQPKLVVHILDLESGQTIQLKSGTVYHENPDIENMNVADLVYWYKTSLLELMDTQCPPMHDPRNPSHQLVLPAMARKPYEAQLTPIQTLLKLLARYKYGLLLGEVGVGKSSMTMAVASALSGENYINTIEQLETMGYASSRKNLVPVKNVLVLCPPHLLKNWQDEIEEVLPAASIRVIERISDLHKPMEYAQSGYGAGIGIWILSRETAKLGHFNSGVETVQCPRCGGLIEHSVEELSVTRMQCQHTIRRPINATAKKAVALAGMLHKVDSTIPDLQAVLKMRHVSKTPEEWSGIIAEGGKDVSDTLYARLVRFMCHIAKKEIGSWQYEKIGTLFAQTMVAFDHVDKDRIIYEALDTVLADKWEKPVYGYSQNYENSETTNIKGIALISLLLGEEYYTKFINKLRDTKNNAIADHVAGYSDRMRFKKKLGNKPEESGWEYDTDTATLSYRGFELGSHLALVDVLRSLLEASVWHTKTCGERLYQSVPQPRRYPIATYISRKVPNLFQLLVVDEGHEYNGDGSAQERAAHRLTKCIPMVIKATGTVMNGYAKNMFRSTWEMSPAFRQEFGRNEVTPFVTRYGYRKVLIETAGQPTDVVIKAFGKNTDRVETDLSFQMRYVGEQAGVLPLFVLKYLSPFAATMLKTDLDNALPAYSEIVMDVEPDQDMQENYRMLVDKSVRAAREDMRTPGMAGKLFGAIGQIPSYLDRCTNDTGNDVAGNGSRLFSVKYPEKMEGSKAGHTVAAAMLFPASRIMPKEKALLDTLETELAEGRNVVILCAHTGGKNGTDLRMLRLVKERFGDIGVILKSTAVKTGIRKQWINEEVIDKGKRVLIANPVTIQTGLNNLVYFSSLMWLENPACNGTVYRQTCGRLHRPKQTLPVRSYFFVYKKTTQELARDLLGLKIAIATQTDGADMVTALNAAGAGDGDAIDSMELGRAIYELII